MSIESTHQKIDSLQVMRAVGMPFILLAHMALVMMYTSYREPGLGIDTVGFLLTVGEGILDLFFVGSGFTMVYISSGSFGMKGAGLSFLFRRITRVVPAYWFYTMIAIAVSLLMPTPLLQLVDPERVVKSLLFIPYHWHEYRMVIDQPWPILIPGWTLNFEALYYVSFSLFLFLPMKRALTAFTGFVAVILCVHQFIPNELPVPYFWTSPQMLKFLSGCWLGYLYLQGRYWNINTKLAALLIAVALIVHGCTYFFLANTFKDRIFFHAIIAVCASIVVGCMVMTPLVKKAWPKWLVNLGDAAYSIYLCQLPILMVIGIVPYLIWYDLPYIMRWPLGFIGYGVSIAWGLASYKYFEVPVSRALRRMVRFKPIYSANAPQ